MGKHIRVSDLSKIRKSASKENKKVVFTYGTFDLLHSGHATFLTKAKSHGDILVVGISSDKSKKILRGKNFPLIHQKNRSEILEYFDFVDYIVIVDDRDLTPILKALKPYYFYTITTDWKSHLRKPKEELIINSYKGKIIKIKPSKPFASSSDIVEKIADLKIKQVIEYFFGKVNIDLAKGDWSSKKFSGLKTSIREECLDFGDQLDKVGLLGIKTRNKILTDSSILKLIPSLKLAKGNIILSSGSCDLVHSGHARFYAKAKELGGKLILAIPSDRVIRKQKGKGRPIVCDRSRAELMAFFNFVDYVYIFDSEDIIPVLEMIKPNIYFTVEEDWNDIQKSPIKGMLNSWGGKVVTIPPQAEGLSSSKLIKRAAGIRVKQIFKEVLEASDKSDSLKD